MGGKKRKGKKKEKAMDVDPDDPLMQYDSQRLLTTQQDLQDKLSTAKVRRNMLQMEKDMIHDFYHNTRQEIKELEARIKNLDTDMQTLEENHKTQIKVYQQKVKHLTYEHDNNKEQVNIQANMLMTEEKQHHTDNEKDMIKDKKKYKDEYIRDQISNATHIQNEEKDFDLEIQELKRSLNEQRIQLIEQYERKMIELNDELDLRQKVEIHEIEERKNQHINELLKNHEEAFREMKDYYNDITRENLELIRMYKEKLIEIKAQIEYNRVKVEHLKQKREELLRPLETANTKRNTLRKQLKNYEKDVMALRNAKGALQVLKNKEKDLKQNREDLEVKFIQVEKEKKDMYDKFEIAIDQLRSRSNYKNQVLDEVLAVRQAELEKKEIQLRELVQRSGLDQGTVDDICKKMEEAIEAKNSIIKNLRYSMAHATKAYNDAIRVYEAKLVEFGIPAEELGLELLETQTSNMPAGLVAA